MLDREVDVLWETATQMFRGGDYKNCESMLRSILAKDPNLLQARFNLALVLSKGENPEDAVPLYCDCIGRRFKQEECMRGVIRLFVNEKKLRKALRFYKGYVTPEIESENLMQLKCHVLFRLKEYEDCRNMARQMLLRNKDKHEAYFTLALVAEILGDIPDALDNIRIALYIEPIEKYIRCQERLRKISQERPEC